MAAPQAHGKPTTGSVFLSSRGKPYADTSGRNGKHQGGNPLKKPHATACRKVGITGFTIHDWRHHWASHMVMAGCDLRTLMQLGGWESMSMVKRYAVVSPTHMAEAIARLK
jgi:integrase